MKVNEILKEQILEVVENQLRSGEPPETKQTYNRLRAENISDKDARLHIAQCVAIEIYEVMKHQKPFNQERFVKNLKKLPREPF